jgi:hypothetical protein
MQALLAEQLFGLSFSGAPVVGLLCDSVSHQATLIVTDDGKLHGFTAAETPCARQNKSDLSPAAHARQAVSWSKVGRDIFVSSSTMSLAAPIALVWHLCGYVSP